MSLFQCEHCGCVENTALCDYWLEHVSGKGPALCSACGKRGRWHGEFDRVFLPMGKFKTNDKGNLEHIDTGDTDFRKFAICIDVIEDFP